MLIRFNYCPSNPGPNSKPNCRWYLNVQNAIDEYDGKSSIWLRTGKGKYIEISYNKLLELV